MHEQVVYLFTSHYIELACYYNGRLFGYEIIRL